MNRLSVFQKKKGGLAATMEAGSAAASEQQEQQDDYNTIGGETGTVMERQRGAASRGGAASKPPSVAEGGGGVARPSYRVSSGADHEHAQPQDDSSYGGSEEDDDHDDDDSVELDVQNLVAQSAGAIRLSRILRTTNDEGGGGGGARSFQNSSSSLLSGGGGDALFGGGPGTAEGGRNALLIEKVSDPHNINEVSLFAGRRVVPPLRVDPSSIGGTMLDNYPETMLQECLLASPCQTFESTGAETVTMQALQYPNDYSKHKRGLGLFTGGAAAAGVGGGNKRASKLRYVLLARSTNRPLRPADAQRQLELLQEKHRLKQQQLLQQQMHDHPVGEGRGGTRGTRGEDASDRGGGDDYDAMFSPDNDDASKDLSMYSDSEGGGGGAGEGDAKAMKQQQQPQQQQQRRESTIQREQQQLDSINTAKTKDLLDAVHRQLEQEDEVSSFPVLVCMTLHADGSGPDIRKLVPLEWLTTVQDLHSTVVQLAFRNGDTIRLDFGNGGGSPHDRNKAVVMERPLDKERFLWSLLQIHSMLCLSVVERVAVGGRTPHAFLPPLNIRNIDRAELQYVATVNGFLKKESQGGETLQNLLDRQRRLVQQVAQQATREGGGAVASAAAAAAETTAAEEKVEMDDQDALAYDLLMGNHSVKVTLFHSEEERKDAEEILNSTEWTDMLQSGGEDGAATAATSMAERLRFALQSRMRDLEAETCRRLIAWEDEKHLSGASGTSGSSKLHDATDARDTVDALALASLFKTLESLDSELQSMEEWLQDRAAAIKPLTDDCADIEEENRQLEQQWKSYDMLGAEMRRLLESHEIDQETEKLLKNPAAALVYDEDGLVDVDESEDGIEQIYAAGKALLEAMEFPRKSGGMHLKSVAERARGLTSLSDTYCSSLAQIIVTVMEQFKTEVVAGSDNGKVSKNDTHTMIAKKIRDTQRKFQSALLGYIKLIEILAALSPGMLPALRDAYAEMVAEGILMKKRMKGYFQALPGKNAAYLNNAGKNLKDYTPFQEEFNEETVNGPDTRAVLSELLPVIAREAYFTSALFGTNNREQDGREKKRNFENAKNAVDKASTHFRYYVNRTCGIVDAATETNDAGEIVQKGDALLCLVATIYLNEAMDNYIDREKKGGDHSLSLAYVRATILDLRKKADKQWVAWVDRQLEWIRTHDGVPLTGKRAGIFPSFARFPAYLDHVILCCKEGREEGYMPDLPGIKVINYYMQKLAVTLLESLRECASRETTDQSYAANVMQMENTYFFTQAIKERGDMMSKMFAKQVTKANAICKESTDAYLGWMIKREFTALHELFSRVSKIRKEMGDSEVIHHVPKNQFVKILQKEANREILKEKIGSLFSRMEKHLSEEGDLLPVAWKALVKVLFEWFGRWEKLCTAIYRHKLDPSPVDVVRIAKAAGGQAKVKAPAQGGEFGFKSILALGNKQDQKPPS